MEMADSLFVWVFREIPCARQIAYAEVTDGRERKQSKRFGREIT